MGPNMLRPIMPAPMFSLVSSMMRELSCTRRPLFMRLPPNGKRDHRFMEKLATLAERVLLALVRTGDESVQRDRNMTPELAHPASSVRGRCGAGSQFANT